MIDMHSEGRWNNQKNMQNVIPGPTITVCAINEKYNDGDNKDVSSKGVDTCYAFKSRLQEYAQKIGIPTPIYYTVKEGPSHQPVFKSTVTVNDVAYDSLPGFSNRKTAEQSAAEVALIEIYKSGQMIESIPTVHESGLCKNLLQEYAQKMNYAIPVYKIRRLNDSANPFVCTVDIGGIQYIGTAARTKKEAEIKVARTALLAIQNSSKNDTSSSSQYIVLPGKKKGNDIADQLKPKKQKTKKKWQKRKFPRKNKSDNAASENSGQTVNLGNNVDGQSVNPVNNVDDQSADTGNNVDGQSADTGNNVDGQSANTGNNVDDQSVNTGNNVDDQSDTGTNVDRQSDDTGNNVDGQSANTGNNFDGHSANTGNNVDGQSANHDYHVDGQSANSGSNVDGQSANSGSNADGQSANSGGNADGQSVNPGKNNEDVRAHLFHDICSSLFLRQDTQ